MSYLLAFVGFSLLIILHEFGHFAAAKKVGMRVERFSLFFPPHIWKRKRGETEYAIGTIPLGGYVRISGMSPHEELPEEVQSRAYLNMPVWKRIVVIAAGPLMNILIALLIFVALFLVRRHRGRGHLARQGRREGLAGAGQLRPATSSWRSTA